MADDCFGDGNGGGDDKESKKGANCYKVLTINMFKIMVVMVMIVVMMSLVMTKSPGEALTVTRWSPL